MITKFFQSLTKTAKIVCLGFMAVVLICGAAVPNAIAMPTASADAAMSRAANELDRVAGDVTSAQIEGKVKSDIGTVERSVGKVTGQVEGAAKQAEGKVKSDIGRIQSAAEDVRDDVEDASEGFVDSVKDFFN